MIDPNFFTNYHDSEHMLQVQNAINLWDETMSDEARRIIEKKAADVEVIVWKGAVFAEPAPIGMFKAERHGLLLINNVYILSFTSNPPTENSGWNLLMLTNANVSLKNDGVEILDASDYVQYGIKIEGNGITPNDLYNNIKSIINERKKLVVENYEAKKEYREKKIQNSNIPPEFSFKKTPYIISANPIPNGFTYERPVMLSYTKRMGLSNYANPSSGYQVAFQACINGIKESIDNREYDALFNLKVISNSVEGDYDVVVYGDAVKVY
ncbi:hypothetical protein [Companilactobacillus ginsenosidimutans]|uniref:Uncharacterized protein n=1 Tax=Companilactobacillus ginsenosidimutans TaxID=1007676 RepID=A0A0H4R292_9LACO|nr:hypothetical protein [Companilactobacillus ginsenosidimutans]AKP67855.1 hypothetical protein ABM34_10145 [Companilactobacillus ginsenosidimutans]